MAILSGGSYTISGLLTSNGAINVADTGVLNATAGGMANNTGGTIIVSAGGTVKDDLTNSGAVNNAGKYNANVDNKSTGTILNSGTWTGNLTSNLNAALNAITNSGTWNGDASNAGGITNSGTWTTQTTAGFNNSGTLTLTAGTIDATNGGLTNTNTGTIDASGGTIIGAVTNSGTLAVSGKLTVTGSLAFGSASTYMLTLNGSGTTNTATTNVSGTAAITSGAKLAYSTSSTITAGQTYTLLTATNGVSGRFNAQTTVSTSTGNYSENVTYGPSSGNSYVQTSFTPLSAKASYLPFGVNSFTMQNSFASTVLNPAIGYRGGQPGGYGPALGFAPEDAAPENTQGLYNFVAPQAPLDALMRSLDHDYTYSVWASAYGGYSSLSGNTAAGSASATSAGGGLVTGIDYRFQKDTVIGFALGGGTTTWNATGGNTGTSNIFQAALYGSHRFGDAYVSGSIAYAFDQLNTTRASNFNARFNGNGGDGRLETGYRFQMPEVNLTPYIAAEGFVLATPAYGETANNGIATYALNYSPLTTTDIRAEVGVWADRLFDLDSSKLLIRGKVGFAHDTWSNVMLNASFKSFAVSPFTMTGITPPSNIGLASLVSEVRYPTGWALGVKVDGEFAPGNYSFGATGTLRYSW